MLYAIAIAIVLIVYFYRKASLRRQALRQQARDGFQAIQTAINYWSEEPDNPERTDLAIVSMALYDDWRKRSALFPIKYRELSPEEFELADEWKKLLLVHDNPPGEATGLHALRFRDNLLTLRRQVDGAVEGPPSNP